MLGVTDKVQPFMKLTREKKSFILKMTLQWLFSTYSAPTQALHTVHTILSPVHITMQRVDAAGTRIDSYVHGLTSYY